jgi:hypothetical protein
MDERPEVDDVAEKGAQSDGWSQDGLADRRCRFCHLLLSTTQLRRDHELNCRESAAQGSSQADESTGWLKKLSGAFDFFIKAPYTHNPFYLISAALVLYGLNLAFGMSAKQADAWNLLSILAGYTSLMTMAAILIVRAGEVWEDARSILLVIVVLLLGLSVSFDEILARMPLRGGMFMLTGLLFALGICGTLLRWLRIRLPRLYRFPAFAVIALFFVYPTALTFLEHVVGAEGRHLVGLGIYLFPAVAGLISLALVPAIRKGARYVKDNGTPWSWPGFPWMLFVVLGGAVVARTHMLGLSFYPAWLTGSPFQTFFLVPFLLCVSVLLLELGIVTDKKSLRGAAQAIPVLGLILCLGAAARGRVQTDFLQVYMSTAGPPLLLGAVLSAGFYAYAWKRGAQWSEAGIVLSLLALAVTGRDTVGPGSLVVPRALPLLGIALLELWAALRRRSSRHALAGSVVLILAGAMAFQDSWFVAGAGVIPIHLGAFAVLAIGALFRDRLARILENAGAFILCGLFVTVLIAGSATGTSIRGMTLYALVMFGSQLGYGWLMRNRLYAFGFLATLLGTVLYGTGQLVVSLIQGGVPEGTAHVIVGVVFFVVALFISCLKADLVQKGMRWTTRILSGPA